MDIEVVMMCSAHGPQKWAGHVCCTECGRTYEMETLPAACTCGASFDLEADELTAALRMAYDRTLKVKRICKKCFKYFKKRGGRIPVETRKPS